MVGEVFGHEDRQTLHQGSAKSTNYDFLDNMNVFTTCPHYEISHTCTENGDVKLHVSRIQQQGYNMECEGKV
jgi:hypothetical protein